jgi:hypothetical protein
MPVRNTKANTPKPTGRRAASLTEFTDVLRNEGKASEASEASRVKLATRRLELKAEERKIKLTAKVTKSQKELDYAHEKAKMELENERLRLQIQLANVNTVPVSNTFTLASTPSQSTFPYDHTILNLHQHIQH